MRPGEVEVLEDFSLIQYQLEKFHHGKSTMNHDYKDEFKKVCKEFDCLWEDVQEYYIQHYARGILVTAATAVTKYLQYYKPTYVIVDEASKLTEHQNFAVLSRFYDRLRKVVLVGDDLQGKSFQVETNSEMGKTVEVSLMTRLVKTGVSINMLIEQYRLIMFQICSTTPNSSTRQVWSGDQNIPSGETSTAKHFSVSASNYATRSLSTSLVQCCIK